ncbi:MULTISPECIES: PTS cellobiose transporter subunit IIC [unclassified Companilactobacillus]|uniref:PTS cellobiose transporter subunit IIC n=1 Tax=unclassified Companilactobacillus TaxID=2767904 RepID=UPI002FF25198
MAEKKTNRFINDKVIPLAGKMASSRHLTALRDGMTLAVPMIIIGSFFMIIAQFPIQAYLDFMASVFGKNWATVLQYPTNASFHIMGLVALVGISYNLAKSYRVDPISASIVSLGAFILTIPLKTDHGALWIPLQEFDSGGLFTAIIVGLFVTDLYVWMVHRKWTIKMPDTVPPAVSNSFAALFPGLIILILVWLIRIGVEATPMESIPNIVSFFLADPLSHLSNTFMGAIVAEFMISLLWVFGVHGANVVLGIMMPTWLSALNANQVAFSAGKPLPNIVTTAFFDNFVHMGGAGATIGLAMLLAFASKSRELKTLGKLVAGPALFNINEPILFGLPIVMNYKMLIPFILTPLVNVTTTYFAMATDLVARPMGTYIPWLTPPILSGFIATGHLSGSVIQIINIILDTLIYWYFFKSMDREKLASELGHKKRF